MELRETNATIILKLPNGEELMNKTIENAKFCILLH